MRRKHSRHEMVEVGEANTAVLDNDIALKGLQVTSLLSSANSGLVNYIKYRNLRRLRAFPEGH